MSERNGFDPATGAWNDSLTGDFLWSRNNFGEARPDVMNDYSKRQTTALGSDRPRAVAVLWILRAILALTILAEAGIGDLLSASEALLALALCTLPGALLRWERGPSPLDIEIVLLLMAVGNCTLGVAGNFYRSLPFYDKFLHLLNPLALAYYGLLLLATSFDSGPRHISLVALVMLTALAITGASAVWELLEYGSDQLFSSTTQGSPTMGPLDDTMWDLILSSLGALLGAIAAAVPVRGGIMIATTGRDRRVASSLYAGKGVQVNKR